MCLTASGISIPKNSAADTGQNERVSRQHRVGCTDNPHISTDPRQRLLDTARHQREHTDDGVARPVDCIILGTGFVVDPRVYMKDVVITGLPKQGQMLTASNTLADLDGGGSDPDLEIIVGALDRHVYAWRANGDPVSGFPVLLADPQ